MRHLRWLSVIVAFVVIVAACGDDDEGTVTSDDDVDDAPTVADDADSADADADDAADDDDGVLAQNFVTIDGDEYAVTIGTCFASPGVDLEVVASLRGSPDSEAYAYVFADGDALTLSALRIIDATNGLDWSNESGAGATALTLEEKRISGEAPVTSPDGGTATATFDFVCPG